MVLTNTLNPNPIFAFMRAWFNYMLIILVSMLCNASIVFGAPAIQRSSVKLTVVQTASVKQHNPSERYDQLDDTEVIIAAYTQYNAPGPVVLLNRPGLKTVIYPAAHANCKPCQNKALIQPLYKLILFPFHGFW
jgi:hypothetical protein